MLFVFKIIVLHWGTNQECCVNQGNTVVVICNNYAYIITCYTEILEALSSSSPVSVITAEFTTTDINTVTTTVSQQCGRSTTVHHTSSVSSVIYTTTSGNGVTQLQQSVLWHNM